MSQPELTPAETALEVLQGCRAPELPIRPGLYCMAVVQGGRLTLPGTAGGCTAVSGSVALGQSAVLRAAAGEGRLAPAIIFPAGEVAFHPDHTALLQALERPVAVGPEDPGTAAVCAAIDRIASEAAAVAPAWRAAQRAWLLLALVQAYRAAGAAAEPRYLSPAENKALQVKQYLDEHYYSQLDLTALAGMAELTPRHLGEVFRRCFHVTPIEYLTRVRVEHAKRLLRQTNKAITDICFEVGFESLSHFYRVFSRHVRVSPRRYRLE